ncbi:thermonuclease family protein [Thalassotalea piscium]|uniref:Endonuclease YncB(Thermonuclease family) n=1 Tax=Thalassotalea piscium TaxID=1230533 RepID=A0A7X0NGK2_9GAMM|nr:hypothetical protein [Thalassotalea piscium]MBB6543071.1 endonuclease YncB(thermonuclease family) [Thalassotalea piscium]
MNIRTILSLFCLFITFFTQAGDLYYAKVVKVDSNNVIHLLKGESIRAISLGYITTPVEGEVYHTEVNSLLNDTLLGNWVKITELSYGANAIVKPALVRTRDLELVNTLLLQKGLAIPNHKTSPPQAINTHAQKAREKSLGLWGELALFNHQRSEPTRSRIKIMMENYKASLEKAKLKGVEPYVGDSKTNIAYKLKCLMSISKPLMFATKYVALNKGYTLEVNKCPKNKS